MRHSLDHGEQAQVLSHRKHGVQDIVLRAHAERVSDVGHVFDGVSSGHESTSSCGRGHARQHGEQRRLSHPSKVHMIQSGGRGKTVKSM